MGVIAPAAPARQPLTDLAKQICDELAAADAAYRDVATHILAAGRALIKAKDGVNHTEWVHWLKRNCSVGERHAQRLMKLARAFDENGHSVSDLVGLSLRGLMQVLTPPKPKATRVSDLPPPSPKATDRKPTTNGAGHHAVWALWDRLSPAERRSFFEMIGRDGVINNVPDKWRPEVETKLSDWKPWANMPADCHHGDDVTIPTFLQRTAA